MLRVVLSTAAYRRLASDAHSAEAVMRAVNDHRLLILGPATQVMAFSAPADRSALALWRHLATPPRPTVTQDACEPMWSDESPDYTAQREGALFVDLAVHMWPQGPNVITVEQLVARVSEPATTPQPAGA